MTAPADGDATPGSELVARVVNCEPCADGGGTGAATDLAAGNPARYAPRASPCPPRSWSRYVVPLPDPLPPELELPTNCPGCGKATVSYQGGTWLCLDATCGFASAERPVMPTDPQRRPALPLIRALGYPLDPDDAREVARRLREHQRILWDVLPACASG